MAIRMVDDDPNAQERDDQEWRDQNEQQNRDNEQSDRAGGFNPMLLLGIPMLLRMFKGKWLFLLIIAGVVYYFWSKSGSSLLSDDSSNPGRGCEMKQEIYDQAEVYEPLAVDRNTMPSSVSLEKYCPPRLNQGQQGSCVGWGSSYAARTILEATRTGQNPKDIAFSPAYLYNQIGLEGCQGAYIKNAMDVLSRQGDLPFSQFPYDQYSCDNQPSSSQVAQAAQYRMKGYNRLSVGSEDYKTDINGIKQHLAAGAPVVFGMFVTESFTNGMMGRKVWRPTSRDYNGPNLGGHCMCLVGYDDNFEGGAFQVMNSWGKEWGENGIAWIKYNDFLSFTQEAYGTYPMGSISTTSSEKLAALLGLVDTDSKKYIPLTYVSGNVFKSSSALRKGQKFKIEIKNSTECYVYCFTEESNGTSSVLFPYNKKHSPYCGVTGSRLFPKNQSMIPDEVGNKDYMAVIVSKTPLDYAALNNKINQSRQVGYANKINDVFRNTTLQDVRFGNSNGAMAFQADKPEKKAVAMIVEISKQ